MDLSGIEPGAESIELISQGLLRRFVAERDHRVFLVFCKINADRIGDYVTGRVDQEGWPLSADEILTETFARLFRQLRSEIELTQGMSDDRGESVYRFVVRGADEVMHQRVEDFLAMRLPLPGLPPIPTSPPAPAVEAASALVQEQGWKLSEQEVKDWVSFALLRMDRLDRRALHLREMRGLDLGEIADELGCTPFEVAQRLKAAHEQLRGEILRVIEKFAGKPGEHPNSVEGDRGEPEPESSDEEDGDD